MKTIQDKEKEIIEFYTDAFCVDGKVRLLFGEEKLEILKQSKIGLIELNDSKRGKFYIAVLKKQRKRDSK